MPRGSIAATDQRALRGDVKMPLWARARAHTEEALGVLVSIMRDDSASEAVRAACADRVLDRAWGKAPIIVAGDETRPITVDVRSLDRERLAALESALMRALGEGINEAVHGGHSGIASPAEGPMQSLPIDAILSTGSTNQEQTSESPFVLDNGALQHGDGALAPEGLRGGEGGAE